VGSAREGKSIERVGSLSLVSGEVFLRSERGILKGQTFDTFPAYFLSRSSLPL